MNEERLNAFEKMLSDILAQYDSVTEKLAALKAEGKEKTVTIASFLQTNCNIKRYCLTTGHTVFWIMIRNAITKRKQKCVKTINKLGIAFSGK